MHSFLVTLNSFLEDSSVLVAVAYLLTRGHLLTLLFPPSNDRGKHWSLANILVSGFTFGAVGATEYIFPNLRYPYSTPTLFVTFAAFSRDVRVGLVAEVVILLGAVAGSREPRELATIALATTASLAVGDLMRRVRERLIAYAARHGHGYFAAPDVYFLLTAFISGIVSQFIAIELRDFYADMAHVPLPHAELPAYALASIPANGVGMALLQLIVREARLRMETARLRREAEAARSFAAQQQLAALRARVHPHFLFNTLNSIAALCAIAPDRAEAATVQLAEVMRRVLEAPPQAVVAIDNEVSDARAYLEIERHRYGDRLSVEWRIAPEAVEASVPPFAITTLVDNAVNHGIAARTGRGTVVVTVRTAVGKRGPRVLVAIQDNGVGMTPYMRRSAISAGLRPHGLVLLNDQLRLIFGPPARLRLFSQVDVGTLAVFAVPLNTLPTTGRTLLDAADLANTGDAGDTESLEGSE